jgi:ribonuclease P protein component
VTDTQCTPPRVAFALGRRNGNAPTRNRLRRQLRAIMSHGDVVVPPGLFLIGHNGNIESCSVSSLRLEVGSLLNRIGARK